MKKKTTVKLVNLLERTSGNQSTRKSLEIDRCRGNAPPPDPIAELDHAQRRQENSVKLGKLPKTR